MTSMGGLILKWKLAVSELEIYKVMYLELNDFTEADKYRELQKILYKCIADLMELNNQ